MPRAKSISVGDLSKAVEKASAELRGQYEGFSLENSDFSIGTIPGHSTVGLIIRDPDRIFGDNVRNVAPDIATSIVAELGADFGDIRREVIDFDGGILVGFMPPLPIQMR